MMQHSTQHIPHPDQTLSVVESAILSIRLLCCPVSSSQLFPTMQNGDAHLSTLIAQIVEPLNAQRIKAPEQHLCVVVQSLWDSQPFFNKNISLPEQCFQSTLYAGIQSQINHSDDSVIAGSCHRAYHRQSQLTGRQYRLIQMVVTTKSWRSGFLELTH